MIGRALTVGKCYWPIKMIKEEWVGKKLASYADLPLTCHTISPPKWTFIGEEGLRDKPKEVSVGS